ncbi:MAG: PIN domain-containing protein [Chloroflexota bacterium]|nr:PIN domain-containing protein [Chloroflexota bacterium]
MTLDNAPFFLDTAYIVALANADDQWHQAAARWEERLARGQRRVVTTAFVLAEIGDGLAAVRRRSLAVSIIDLLLAEPRVEIVPASSDLFAAAFALYRTRPDQGWGLADCASFVVMRERGLTAALTADTHFRQAGFRALLLEEVPS